jgi:hypothetical protein
MDNLSPDQIKAMINMLQTMLNSQSSNQDQNDAEEPDNQVDVLNTKRVKSNRSVTRQNKFTNMPEMNMHKDDVAIDKKLKVQPPVPRARPFKLLKVVCRVCGRNDEINPALLVESPNRYKCNNCSTSAG